MEAVLSEDENRFFPPECGFNFRDFGGYETADGARVAMGKLYRSGVMAHVEGEALARLVALGIVSICDLRTTRERTHRPTVWHGGSATKLYERDYAKVSGDLVALAWSGELSAAAMREKMADLYRDLPYYHAESYRAMFARLAEGAVPLLVNCSAGKDRTGVAVALVLSALGVPRETIVADYALTARADFDYLMRYTSRQDMPPRTAPETMRVMLAAEPDYLAAMFETVDARHGSVEAYLAEELGVGAAELAQIRNHLLDA